jgi:hypothetical protein
MPFIAVAEMDEAMRAAVVKEALTWLGTPYHHHARVKGVGVDCARLLCAVYEASACVPHIIGDRVARVPGARG